MSSTETLEEFYKRKLVSIPQNIKNKIGHFNIFRHEPVTHGKSKPLPYRRRDFYKIMLVMGNIDMVYADRVISIKKQALFFSNPQIPYTCDQLENIREGVYCIFNKDFFLKFGDLTDYAVFQPAGNHVFELNDAQTRYVSDIYKRMFEEIESDYEHKYDVMRNLVFEIIHFALKTQPATSGQKPVLNAAQRISSLFFELLERQFPMDENHPSINLRSASDFALQLNVHVNHLNRAIKQITQKTTTQLISQRIMQEAKIMLKQSDWNIAEIAYALGFAELTHFTNFFKKHTGVNPSSFRNSGNSYKKTR